MSAKIQLPSLVAIEPVREKQSDSFEPVTLSEPEIEPQVNNPQEQSSIKKHNRKFWTVFNSTFLTIFLAEMGDKTQLATLLMSAESHSPWIVFTGAAVALVTTSLLGVLIGRWLSKWLSPKTLEVAMATLLLIVSVLLLGDVVHC